MAKDSRALLVFRFVASALGAGLIWYGVVLRESAEGVVEQAYAHAARDQGPSKAEAGGSLLDMFTNVFGWVAVGFGVVLVLLAMLPWSRILPDQKP